MTKPMTEDWALALTKSRARIAHDEFQHEVVALDPHEWRSFCTTFAALIAERDALRAALRQFPEEPNPYTYRLAYARAQELARAEASSHD